MKYFLRVAFLGAVFFSAQAGNAATWANCVYVAQVEPIRDLFWKSAVQGEDGTERQLPSGQRFEFSAPLCRTGAILKVSDWIAELKGGITSVKTISQFQSAESAEGITKFLSGIGLQVSDTRRLKAVLDAFLRTKSVDDIQSPSSAQPQSTHPAVVIGKSATDAVILFGSSDDQSAAATILKIKLNAVKSANH